LVFGLLQAKKEGADVQIIYKKVSDLIPYVNNARKNDGAVEAVASSIKNYGFKQPIVIDSQGEIIAGHTRLKASKKLGLKEVPCIIADDLTPAQIKAYRIADNRVGELAEWDMELLQLELADIEGFTGFEDLDFGYSNDNYEEEITTKDHGQAPQEAMEKYMNSSIRQIILTFDMNQYEKVIKILDMLQDEFNVDNNTDAILKVLEDKGYEVY